MKEIPRHTNVSTTPLAMMMKPVRYMCSSVAMLLIWGNQREYSSETYPRTSY